VDGIVLVNFRSYMSCLMNEIDNG